MTSTQVAGTEPAPRRKSVYVSGYRHENPIPAACRVDNVIYSSLVHGIDRARKGSGASLEAQAELMFARLRSIVEAAGAGLEDVVKVNVRMRDRADRGAINRFWLELFPDPESRPARQTLDAPMDGEQLIQCDFVAVVRTNERGDSGS